MKGERYSMPLFSRDIRTDEASIAMVEEYTKREIYRPKTKWWVPALILLCMIAVPFGVGFLLLHIFPSFEPLFCYLITYILLDLILLRLFLIKSIRCYQHYAPEELRRFCKCMPSCSEYSIAVLKKYPLFIAIFKVIYRMFVTCDSQMKIDMP